MSKGKEIQQLKEIDQSYKIGVHLGDGGNAEVDEATNLKSGVILRFTKRSCL